MKMLYRGTDLLDACCLESQAVPPILFSNLQQFPYMQAICYAEASIALTSILKSHYCLQEVLYCSWLYKAKSVRIHLIPSPQMKWQQICLVQSPCNCMTAPNLNVSYQQVLMSSPSFAGQKAIFHSVWCNICMRPVRGNPCTPSIPTLPPLLQLHQLGALLS